MEEGASWILGHLVNVLNDLGRVLGVEPVREDPRLARAGAEPITNPDEAIDWEALVAALAAGEARIADALAALTGEDLGAVSPTPGLGDTPRGIFLATVLVHQACDAGQLATARRLAGHPGAIRIPGTGWGRLRGMRMGGCGAKGRSSPEGVVGGGSQVRDAGPPPANRWVLGRGRWHEERGFRCLRGLR